MERWERVDRELSQVVTIELFGGVRAVADDGTTLDVGPTKSQTVLATLALSPGRAVPVSRLVDVVWGDDPPRTADKTLQSHVVRLRRALGAEAIVRVGAAYRLDIDADAVDVARFRQRLTDGDVRAALVEWTGPPLAGLDAPGLTPVVDGLVEEWLGAVEGDLGRRVDADPAAAVGALTELTATHPFRERLWELLMTALYRAGRQADALAAFQTAREQLVCHLGVDPGPRLRALESRILDQDDRLHDPRDGAPAPRASSAARGEGGGQRDDADHAAPLPDSRRATLPHRLGRLIGRNADVDRVHDALAAASVVTLVGPGGVGKTSLAVEAARTFHHHLELTGQVWFVELTEIAASDDVPRAAAGVVGAREAPGRDLTAALTAVLQNRPGLLVLDNCEHVIDGAAELAHAVAQGCPDVTVLATSREALGFAGERVVVVAPLDPTGPGVELFIERASAVSSTFATASSRADVEEICRRLDGLPLAIELAAARTVSLTTADLVARLDDRLRLLTGRRRGVHERQRTLRATLQWSYDLLTPAEQDLFAQLSTFSGPFDAAAARYVAGDGDLDVVAVDDLLAGLAERSLVVVGSGPFGRRYRLLETMREFGADLLAAAGRTERVAARHARWCIHEAVHAAELLPGPAELDGAARIVELWPNLRAAFDRACDRGDPELADALVRPVASELGMRGRLEIGDWAERILALLPPDDDRVAYWLMWATQRAGERGDNEALDDLVGRLGHGEHPAVRHARAILTGSGDELVAASRETVTWLRARDEPYLADWMEIVGVAAGLLRGGRLGEHDAFTTALADRHRHGGAPTFLHWALFMLGYAALFRGEHDRAERWFDESATVDVPPGTFSATKPAEARAAFRRGDLARALRIVRDHAVELLSTDNTLVASRLLCVEFVTIMVAIDRIDAAARMLGYLQEAGEFWPLIAGTVAGAAERITAHGDHDAELARGQQLGDREALAFMRDVIDALPDRASRAIAPPTRSLAPPRSASS